MEEKMKQMIKTSLKDVKRNVIYPIYEEQMINQDIIDQMEYPLDDIVDKKLNAVTTIYTLGKYDFQTMTFIGLGSMNDIKTQKVREVAEKISKIIKESAILYGKDLDTDRISIHEFMKVFTESYMISSYEEVKRGHEQKHMIDLDIMSDEDIQKDIDMGRIYSEGINYARYLSDLPSNLMTPDNLVREALNLAEKYDLECTILDKQQLEEMGAGGLLSVNLGSHIPAYMICLKYHHADTPYHAIIGKGITFDSGGYNLKENSYGMKYDMCGAADVLGIMRILAEKQVHANVYGIVPTTENLVSGKAYKPQDVITTLSKKTVEIVSTDAEGRLILCDAITYAQQLGVSHIIDLATLTGACVSALGDVYTGVFSNSDEFYHQFEKSMQMSDEKGWRLPVAPEYFQKLESSSADFKNSVGKPGGGASVAANFLEAFVDEGVQWIHLDIAGTADDHGKGATGVMIRSIVNLYE